MYNNITFVLFIVFSLFFGLTSNKIFSRDSQFFIAIYLIVLISFFIGYRSIDSGTDTREYYDYFQSINNYTNRFEPGFDFFSKIIKKFFEYNFYFFLICFFSLILLLISCRLNNVNFFVFLGVLLSFLPGLDLFTNGIRNGLAISVSIFIISLFISMSKSVIFTSIVSSIGATIHISSLIFTVFLPMTKFLSVSRAKMLHLFLFSIFLCFLCNTMGVDLIRAFALPYGSDVGFLGKLSRYVLLDDELLNPTVKLYFYFVSACFMLFPLIYVNEFKNDIVILFVRVSLLGFFSFSIFYFSAYSFRFMLLFFFFQVMCSSYVISNNICGRYTKILFFIFVLLNLFLTYSSKTFTSMELLSIF